MIASFFLNHLIYFVCVHEDFATEQIVSIFFHSLSLVHVAVTAPTVASSREKQWK